MTSLGERINGYARQFIRERVTTEERNAWFLYLDIGWYGILAGVASAFLSIFVIRLGGSNTLVGMLTSIPALLNIVWLMPAARIIERQSRKLPVIMVTGFLSRFAYFLVAVMPFVISIYRPELAVAIVVLSAIPAAVVNIAFTSLLADVVPVERRAHVVSVRNALLGISATIATLLGGRFLEILPLPFNYQVLFLIGFGASLISLYYVSRIEVPDRLVLPRAPGDRRSLLTRVRNFLKMLTSNRPWVRFTVSSLAYYWGLYLPIPLYSIYWVRYLHASDGWIGLINVLNNAISVLFYPFWGRLATRRGNRLILLICVFGMSFYPLLTGLSTTVEPLLGIAILGGIFAPGFSLTFFNTLLEVSPDERRPSFIAAYNALVNIPAFVAPLVGTALIDIIGIQNALLLGGGFRLLGFLVCLKLPATK